MSMNVLLTMVVVTRGVRTCLVHFYAPVAMDTFYLMIKERAWMLTSVQMTHMVANNCALILLEDSDVTVIVDFS